MAESFDCPKCGAPMAFNADTQGNQESITCPYCGETVIVPPNLRATASRKAKMAELESLIETTRDQANQIPVQNAFPYPPAASPTFPAQETPRRGIRGCLIAALIAVCLLGIAGIFSLIAFKTALLPATGLLSPTATESAPPVAQATITVAAPEIPTNTPAPEMTATPANTPTPRIDFSATAVEATRVARNLQITTQRNWPVLLQEKFTNNKQQWVVGKDSNNLDTEVATIAGNKYTWNVTTKKGVATFTFPSVAAQTNVYISVDLQMTTDSTNANDAAGIIFHRTASDNSFYFFGVNPSGTYSLSLFDGTQWNDLIPVTQTDKLNSKDVNHIGVSIQDSQILLEINNEVVDGFEDSQLASGEAGLAINLPASGETATVIYTNFYIRAPKP